MYTELPPGLDPVAAGRFGLWLLGKRSHQRALKRRVTGTSVRGTAMAGRLVALLLPWTVDEYPGAKRFTAAICGVSQRTVERWFWSDVRLPPKHAATLAALCRSRAEQFAALADELEARAREKPRSTAGKANVQRERRLLRDV